MAKTKNSIEVVTRFDGEQDATSLFTSLILEEYRRRKSNHPLLQYNWLEAQHPAGLFSVSSLSYNKGSNWLTFTPLGLYECPQARLSAIPLL